MKLEYIIFFWKMLICAFKAQVNGSNIETICWNVCIKFNL